MRIRANQNCWHLVSFCAIAFIVACQRVAPSGVVGPESLGASQSQNRGVGGNVYSAQGLTSLDQVNVSELVVPLLEKIVSLGYEESLRSALDSDPIGILAAKVLGPNQNNIVHDKKKFYFETIGDYVLYVLRQGDPGKPLNVAFKFGSRWMAMPMPSYASFHFGVYLKKKFEELFGGPLRSLNHRNPNYVATSPALWGWNPTVIPASEFYLPKEYGGALCTRLESYALWIQCNNAVCSPPENPMDTLFRKVQVKYSDGSYDKTEWVFSAGASEGDHSSFHCKDWYSSGWIACSSSCEKITVTYANLIYYHFREDGLHRGPAVPEPSRDDYSIDDRNRAKLWPQAASFQEKRDFVLNYRAGLFSPPITSQPLPMSEFVPMPLDESEKIWAILDPSTGEWELSLSPPTQEPVSSLTLEHPHFSPNGDGVKDSVRIGIEGGSDWTLSLETQGVLLKGNGAASFVWDGKVNGRKVPDGAYQLVLKDVLSGTEPTPEVAPITVDTAKPRMRFSVNGEPLNPQEGKLIDDVVPEFRVRVSEDLSGVDGVNGFRLDFEARPDGVIPQYLVDSARYDAGTQILSYKVPFEQDSILFPGDQWMRVSITDRAGNTSRRTLRLAVGSHSLPSAGFGVQTLEAPPAPPPPIEFYPVPKGIDVSNAKVLEQDPRLFHKRVRPQNQIPGFKAYIVRGAILGGATAAGAITFLSFDFVAERLRKAIRGNLFEIDTEPIGIVILSARGLDHIIKRNHTETSSASTIARAIINTREKSKAEVWRDSRFKGSSKPGGLAARYLIVSRLANGIFLIPIEARNGFLPYVVSAFGAGVWDDAFPPPLVRQWSGVTKKIAEFRRLDSPLWDFDNPDPQLKNPIDPQYRAHLWGELGDHEQLKPYFVRTGIAVPRRDRKIVSIPRDGEN